MKSKNPASLKPALILKLKNKNKIIYSFSLQPLVVSKDNQSVNLSTNHNHNNFSLISTH